jgi:hypothetical protein
VVRHGSWASRSVRRLARKFVVLSMQPCVWLVRRGPFHVVGPSKSRSPPPRKLANIGRPRGRAGRNCRGGECFLGGCDAAANSQSTSGATRQCVYLVFGGYSPSRSAGGPFRRSELGQRPRTGRLHGGAYAASHGKTNHDQRDAGRSDRLYRAE